MHSLKNFNVFLFFHFVLSSPQKSSWLPRARGPCHLKTFDRYTFSVGVNMTDSKSHSSEVIHVTVKHRFYHSMVTLQKYTQVKRNVQIVFFSFQSP